jgi:hypothetical protein
MPLFQGFRFVGGTYSQGVALGCHIFSLSGWADFQPGAYFHLFRLILDFKQ